MTEHPGEEGRRVRIVERVVSATSWILSPGSRRAVATSETTRDLYVDSEWCELDMHGVGNLAASLITCLHRHAHGQVSRANELARPCDIGIAMTRCFARERRGVAGTVVGR